MSGGRGVYWMERNPPQWYPSSRPHTNWLLIDILSSILWPIYVFCFFFFFVFCYRTQEWKMDLLLLTMCRAVVLSAATFYFSRNYFSFLVGVAVFCLSSRFANKMWIDFIEMSMCRMACFCCGCCCCCCTLSKKNKLVFSFVVNKS